MRRIPSAIGDARLRIVPTSTLTGIRGMLYTDEGATWVWGCAHVHRTMGGAHDCVLREVKRWAAER